MTKPKSRAQQFAELADPLPKDFDPEEDNPQQESDESGSESSDDGLAGTEHYTEVSKSKLRKPEEVALGSEYAGSRVSRETLLNGNQEDESAPSDLDDDIAKFVDPDLEFDVDEEDGDIDSDAAFGESDSDKFKDFTFRGSGNPRTSGGTGSKKRPTASDFMLGSEEDEDTAALNEDQAEDLETDEDILDTAKQHVEDSEEEIFSTARQFAEDMDSENNSDASDDGKNQEFDGDDDENSSSSDQGAENDNEEEEDEDGNSEDDEDDEKARRAELRQIMNDEQKTVVATISQAAKADADKGNAVKQQRKAFDSLLGVRMTLQKALIATNSMAASEEKYGEEMDNQAYEAAEQAAVKLWNTLDGLRHELSKAKTGTKAGQKRKRGVDMSTPASTIWERMQSSEVSMIDTRQTTLEKWSAKVRGTVALPLSRKLNPSVTQSITSVLQDQLASSDHLTKKTKIPRSCAPIQRDLKMTEDPNIFDDGPFYQLLLKELVDQRRVESLTTSSASVDAGNALQWTAVKEAKTKKNVDTKASKGRKMRFTVHEKLQNFMAPEDRCRWEPQAIDRFFGTLLGQKMTLGEDEMEIDGDEGGVELEEEGLKLFRSG